MTTLQTVETPDGPFMIVSDDVGRVIAAGWTDDLDALLMRLPAAHRPTAIAAGETAAAEAAHAYYLGDVHAIDQVPVAQFGTNLQQAGWAVLRTIAPGKPLSYAEFAAQLGSPRAVRAAASVCARNAPALFVPCHRVLRSDGSLGGFAWGRETKAALLAREQRAA